MKITVEYTGDHEGNDQWTVSTPQQYGYDHETLESAEEAIQEAEAIQSAIQSDHGITLEIEVR